MQSSISLVKLTRQGDAASATPVLQDDPWGYNATTQHTWQWLRTVEQGQPDKILLAAAMPTSSKAL